MSNLPIEVRKACLILGVPYGEISELDVEKAWDQQSRTVRLDAMVCNQRQLETEESLNFLKKNRDVLINWLASPNQQGET